MKASLRMQNLGAGNQRYYWLAGLLLLGLSLATACSSAAGSAPPTTSTPDEVARQLADSYMTMVREHDVAGLRELLADKFVVQRPDGSFDDKEAFLADLPSLANVVTPNVFGSQGDKTFVIIWDVASAVPEGSSVQPDLPRISTYVWADNRWQLLSQGETASLID